MAKSEKKRDYLNFLPLLIGIVITILISLFFIPDKLMKKYHLRPIDILSDIRIDTTNQQLIDTTSIKVPEPPRLDTCKTGVVCIDDYSVNQKALERFYGSLTNINQLQRPLRIAFFGDSFTEGDIFCGNLREKLQSVYGGRGVGMLPLWSQTSGFRRTVIQQSAGGWEEYSLIKADKNNMLGISGYSYYPNESAYVYYEGSKYLPHLDTCNSVKVFYYLPMGKVSLKAKFDKINNIDTLLASSGQVQCLNLTPGNFGNVSLHFSNTSNLILYGASLEDTTGVIVDNFSMRGSAGWVLKYIPEKTLKEFNQLIHYDLIIMQYGLNVMENGKNKYTRFSQEMVSMIKYFQSCFPDTDFLLIGVSDRSVNKEGNYVTMPAVHGMIAAQKQICAETGIAFWNLFEAMGGSNSMVDFVNASPPKANKDYTHLNFTGGAFLGNKLFEAIEYEGERYEKKKEYLDLLQKN